MTRLAVPVIAAALVLGVAIGAGVALLTRSSSPSSAPSPPVATWPAGARPAPEFSLTDQDGRPVSLASFRGRPVLVTFLDPLCRDYCPVEAAVLRRAVASVPQAQRPALVSISVNPYGNRRANLLADVSHRRLGADWHWAVGPQAALARVWRDYSVGVQITTKTVAGVTVHQVTHTLATYVVDARGDERALMLWPFTAKDVTGAFAGLATNP